MSFTDDELKILRHQHQHTSSKTKCRTCDFMARLEAAEAVCQSVIDNGDEGNFKFSMKAWRHSKGAPE